MGMKGALPFDMNANNLFTVTAHDVAAFRAFMFFWNVLLDARPDRFEAIGFRVDGVWVTAIPPYHFEMFLSFFPKA